MHSECAAQGVRGVSSLRHLQVLSQQWAVLWIHTVVDDLVSALDWALTTQVSNNKSGYVKQAGSVENQSLPACGVFKKKVFVYRKLCRKNAHND